VTQAPPRASGPRKLDGAGSKVIGDKFRALFGTGLTRNIFAAKNFFIEAVFSMCTNTGRIHVILNFCRKMFSLDSAKQELIGKSCPKRGRKKEKVQSTILTSGLDTGITPSFPTRLPSEGRIFR